MARVVIRIFKLHFLNPLLTDYIHVLHRSISSGNVRSTPKPECVGGACSGECTYVVLPCDQSVRGSVVRVAGRVCDKNATVYSVYSRSPLCQSIFWKR